MMKPASELKVRRLSTKRLCLYVRRNPGLTASQYGRLLNKPYGTISAALYTICKDSPLVLFRKEEQGATGGKAWRYYPVIPFQ